MSGNPLVILGITLLSSNWCHASTTIAPDIPGVLQVVARNYCVKIKPANFSLDRKAAIINNTPDSRSELVTFFGDTTIVDQFFQLNTDAAVIPEHIDYSCFHLAPSGEWSISIPVFSKSGDTAYVYLADNCPGLCGHGEMDVLRLVAGRWRVNRVIQMWVS